MTFKPMRIQENVYKSLLLEGKILKIDGGGHNYVEVIERNNVDTWNLLHNVGKNGGKLIERVPTLFRQTIDELEQENYIVLTKSCDYSGCCQYHAKIYYLKGNDGFIIK